MVSNHETITYRVYKEDDLNHLHSIYLEGYYNLYGEKVQEHADQFLILFEEAWVKGTEGEVFIAELNNKPVGFASIHEESNGGWKFGPIIVIPALQCQGIGTHLLQLCINFAQSKNVSQIYLKVHEHNENSIKLYRKFGFTTIDTFPSDLEGIKYSKMILVLSSKRC